MHSVRILVPFVILPGFSSLCWITQPTPPSTESAAKALHNRRLSLQPITRMRLHQMLSTGCDSGYSNGLKIPVLLQDPVDLGHDERVLVYPYHLMSLRDDHASKGL